jgi:hypothetical protein
MGSARKKRAWFSRAWSMEMYHFKQFSRESETDDLACARGIINATPIALILWGVIIGALVWVL